MQFGISVYVGLEQTQEENLSIIVRAASFGAKYLFTSLHLPEVDNIAARDALFPIVEKAHEFKMKIIADITPESLNDSCLYDAIDILRLDDGFAPTTIAKMTRDDSHHLFAINASSISLSELNELKASNADFNRLIAIHNFYPRENTGLDEAFFVSQNSMIKQFSIDVFSFIPSMHHARGPLYCGLPTLESHRHKSVVTCARHLLSLGVEQILIGDPLPSSEELKAINELNQIKTANDEAVILRIKPLTQSEKIKELLSNVFTSRPDMARDVVRTIESRKQVKEADIKIAAENAIQRDIGAITLDNDDYPRYNGELEIIKEPLPADKRVNVVAKVVPDDIDLIRLIKPKQKILFHFV